MSRKRILCVEDEADMLEMVRFRLEQEGYEVISAANGKEGLDKAYKDKPDLILLDLMLPEKSGYEVCRILKSDTQFKVIPIVIFTARASVSEEQLGYECGADDYITKPFMPDDFINRIKKLLKEEL
ncbi:MAG: hypothetical protein A2Y00_02165 [Omnitrophica WOR_2 bacterium GWF2_43_52]|nr:MAG: hypothetical protein A2Y00_02165 [Omnitrophica WOR_2 bacterium GWF2_43_52]HAH20624.1 two-component system response regulator [Candidatus Omnitrophota bacterium]HBG63542.1 two-component system response regulator [Candidatus Omnitrophota bacterium]